MTTLRAGVWAWVAGILFADQVSKQWIVDWLAYLDSVAVTRFFNLVHVHNYGAAFSLFADQPGWQRIFFVVLAVTVSGFIMFLLRKESGNQVFRMALTLILAGAIGNLIDRILWGYVIDFLDFHAFGWHWPAFNVADIAITCGAALMVLDSFRTRKESA